MNGDDEAAILRELESHLRDGHVPPLTLVMRPSMAFNLVALIDRAGRDLPPSLQQTATEVQLHIRGYFEVQWRASTNQEN